MANAIMTYIEFLLTQDQVVYENNMRPLDLAELVSLSLSVAGLLAATFTQQVIYAAVPLALNLPLSWSIRRRLEQAVSHNTSIAQFPPDSHQNFQDKFDVLNAQLNNKVEIDEFLKLNQREIELTQSFKNCNQKLLELQQLLFKELGTRDNQLNNKVEIDEFLKLNQREIELTQSFKNCNQKLLELQQLLFKELDNRDNQRVEEIEKIQEDLKRLKEAFDKSQSFVWPTTTVKPSLHKLPTDNFKYEEGLLRKYGYKVGIHGNSQSERLKVLDFIFLHQIDGIQDSEYLIKWGQPNTAKRLQKLAESIAAFTRNAKRDKSKDYRKAIQDWEADLAYLKKTYYDNRFSREFGWPRT
ncbi:hypothetical protein IQ224_19175 [Microcystis sp. LEGE 00066]|uniref:Genome sequencing data, contig C320 n=2 Tax=Microcystis aeruginosa (strain PCC 7806) TaxID=267872 RepID=A8YJB6_MICA7|nr:MULTISPECIES: hypothetical protein [Microcystis]MBE9264171.1 hypothetical protein [Microcystis sp. LEGE 00066]WKX62495.1 hypothetical protein Q3H53_002510 [Microcystis aeruginosa PCC 7806]CAO90760.1 unnamed protein product [Microcystis aeruginosa PCC 7806]